ncbi:MAG TPA: hypothetical protein VF516_23580 [Kofleriaceae bacterium]
MVVRHRVLPIAEFRVHKGQNFGPLVMPLPGSKRSVIGFPQLTGTNDVVGGSDPDEWTRYVSTVWQLDGDKVRQLPGAAARAVIQAAHKSATPPAQDPSSAPQP